MMSKQHKPVSGVRSCPEEGRGLIEASMFRMLLLVRYEASGVPLLLRRQRRSSLGGRGTQNLLHERLDVIVFVVDYEGIRKQLGVVRSATVVFLQATEQHNEMHIEQLKKMFIQKTSNSIRVQITQFTFIQKKTCFSRRFLQAFTAARTTVRRQIQNITVTQSTRTYHFAMKFSKSVVNVPVGSRGGSSCTTCTSA